jgi:hypothetical protein
MRKVVLAKETKNEELSFNKDQKFTRMQKETLQKRIQSHSDQIKKRQERIKILTKNQKDTMDPERKRKIAQYIDNHKKRIEYSKEAIAHYRRLSNLKR